MATLLELMAETSRVAAQARSRSLNADRLVILRMGLGRDSVAMLCLLAEGNLVVDERLVRPDEVDAVVFTDPGYEWPATYAVMKRVQAMCTGIGVPFLVQKKPPAEGPKGWIAWLSDRASRRAVMEVAAGTKVRFKPEERPWQTGAPRLPVRPTGNEGPLSHREIEVLQARCLSGYYHAWPPILETYQAREMVIKKNKSGGSCTANHKIAPNRQLIEDMAAIRFGYVGLKRQGGVPSNANWSDAVQAGRRRPHLVLLGFAADEASRVEKMQDLTEDGEEKGVLYEKNAYPLYEAGITRAGEGPILDRHGFGDVQKSGCMMCKFQGADWYWALTQLMPEVYETVLGYEATAIMAADREGRPITDALLLGRGPQRDRASIPTGRLQEHVAFWRKAHPEATPASVLANEYKSCASRYATPKGSVNVRRPEGDRCPMCG